jgi:hypothetical protein
MGVLRMITINLDKAKLIAHDIRRQTRDAEFKPLDVQATIPSMAVEAEAKRQLVRDKYALMQADIDVATNTDTLKQIIEV